MIPEFGQICYKIDFVYTWITNDGYSDSGEDWMFTLDEIPVGAYFYYRGVREVFRAKCVGCERTELPEDEYITNIESIE